MTYSNQKLEEKIRSIIPKIKYSYEYGIPEIKDVEGIQKEIESKESSGEEDIKSLSVSSKKSLSPKSSPIQEDEENSPKALLTPDTTFLEEESPEKTPTETVSFIFLNFENFKKTKFNFYLFLLYYLV